MTTHSRDLTRPLKLAQVLAILVLSVVAATLFQSQPVLHSLLGSSWWVIVGLAGCLFILRNPSLGLPAIVVTGLLVPASIATGTKTHVPAVVPLVLLVFGLWVLESRRRKRPTVSLRGPVVPLLVLLLVTIISLGMGQLHWYPSVTPAPIDVQLGGVGVFLVSAAVFLLAAYQVQEVVWLKRLTYVFLVVGAIYVASGFSSKLLELLTTALGSGSGGSMLWTWIVALAIGQALHNRTLRAGPRGLFIALAAGAILMQIFRERAWVSGWVPAAVAVLVILWLKAPRVGLVLTILGIAVIASRWDSFLALMLAGNEFSFNTRLAAWDILLGMAKANPLFGLGPANYYWYSPLFPILGFPVRFNSHNNYVDLIAQTGYLGLAAFTWFAASVGVTGWRVAKRVPDGFAKGYAYGALGGLAGTLAAGMLGDWILPFVYNVGLAGMRASLLAWLFLGGVVALDRITRTPAHLAAVAAT